MARDRDAHAATLLADGRVLLTGGSPSRGRRWTPSSCGIRRTAFRRDHAASRPAANHTAVLLPDGRLLVVLDGSGPDGVVEPFLYEPELIR